MPLIFLVAGEPSGDTLGAKLMKSLKKQTKDKISFSGIGGNRMEEQGLKSMFPMDELSVMGIAEVLPKIPRLLGRINETAAAIARLRPACVVTIDSPDFNFRVAKRLKGPKKNKGIPIVHYVAPSVWAWRPGRAKKISRFLDHLLTLLPFEPPYFEKEGLPTTFVGHPVIESGAAKGNGPEFRKRHGFAPDDEIISILPGSRLSEVSRLHRIFGETLFMLKKTHPNLRAVVPAAGPVIIAVRRMAGEWPIPTLIVESDQEKFDAFAASNVALAASGTVALELAVAGTPTVIAYKTNILTAVIAKILVKARFANLINLVLDRDAIPEFLQSACRPEFLSAALEDLLRDEGRRKNQAAAYHEALKQLTPKGPSPADQAAKTVLDVISQHRKEGD
ncbi:MAG: lipid-A-disaccharide synthase [Rhodospirillales bacterium]|nr:lipid-A-disaccharide synthase [Rhodospirillales bacterium]